MSALRVVATVTACSTVLPECSSNPLESSFGGKKRRERWERALGEKMVELDSEGYKCTKTVKKEDVARMERMLEMGKTPVLKWN